MRDSSVIADVRLWPRPRRRQEAMRRSGDEDELKRTEAALAGLDRLLAG